MTDDSLVRLECSGLRLAIDPLGAQLVHLQDARSGREMLWHGDPAWWNGRSPILFPIVGALQGGQFRWRGKTFALARHGFARGRLFEIISAETHLARFRLVADESTRQSYPFDFSLELHYALGESAPGMAQLSITALVRNTGAGPMPASLGFHPAFRWPIDSDADRAAHAIRFDQPEPAPVRRLDGAGLLRPDALPSPVEDATLLLRDDLFRDDVLIFDALRSRALTYGADRGTRLRVEFPDATHLGLWTKPGAPFVCIEPWRGVADPAGFAGEFDRKPGVFMVDPGAQSALTMRISLAGVD